MDFFVQPCPSLLGPLQTWAESFATKSGLVSLPQHIHQVVGAFVVYQTIYLVVSPVFSRWLMPRFYNSFNKRTKINWDVHIVSFVQSIFICALALWGMFTDHDRQAAGNDPSDEGKLYRVFGYTVTGGAVQGYATGYFVWDLMISVYYVEIMGIGFVAHAISALVVFSLGFRPFVNYYAPIFILFELSSPFLNIHWCCDKLNLTGSKIQLINGFFLLGTFFCCRLLWGTYNSVLVFRDIFSIYLQPPPATHPSPDDLLDVPMGNEQVVLHPFAGRQVPLWLTVLYLGSNLILNGLNYYWFSRMIQTVAARFKPGANKKVMTGKEKVPEDEKVWVEGGEVDLATAAEVMGKQAEEVRRRYSLSKTQ